MTSIAFPEMNSDTAPSPWNRVLLTFTSPSKAFRGATLGSSWWLPYLLLALVSLGYAGTVGAKVGWEAVTRNNLQNAPKQQARMDALSAAQGEAQIATIARITRVSTYAGSVIAPLLFGAIVAGLLLATLNFGFGGHARFGPLFAVYFFSSLPQIVKVLLVGAMLWLGLDGDAFQISNPIGSNPAFYLQGSGISRLLLSILTWVDVFVIWQLVLLIIGSAIVAGVNRGKAATAVLGWTGVFIGIGAALAAIS